MFVEIKFCYQIILYPGTKYEKYIFAQYIFFTLVSNSQEQKHSEIKKVYSSGSEAKPD